MRLTPRRILPIPMLASFRGPAIEFVAPELGASSVYVSALTVTGGVTATLAVSGGVVSSLSVSGGVTAAVTMGG